MSEQIISQQGYKKLKKELEELINKRKNITDRIASAKELGDLSENSEYHEAKDSQGFNEAKIREIKQYLKNAKIINEFSDKKVIMGSTVIVSAHNTEKEFEIVSFNEANPGEGKISNESPLGMAILGKEKGSIVVINTPRGEIEYKILSIK